MNRIEFTEDMDEVSGLGGFYERCCRAAVIAGTQWLLAHPDENPVFGEYKDVFGIVVPENEAARSIDEAVLTALVTHDDGTKSHLKDELTGAQMHAVAHHLLFIAKHGWNAYREQMSATAAKADDA